MSNSILYEILDFIITTHWIRTTSLFRCEKSGERSFAKWSVYCQILDFITAVTVARVEAEGKSSFRGLN